MWVWVKDNKWTSVSSPKNDLAYIFGVVFEVPFVHLNFASSPFFLPAFSQIYPATNIWKQGHRNDEDCSWWLRCRQTSDGVRSPEISRDFHSVQEGHWPNYCEEKSLSPESPSCEVLSETLLRKLELPTTPQAGGCLCHSPRRYTSNMFVSTRVAAFTNEKRKVVKDGILPGWVMTWLPLVVLRVLLILKLSLWF